MPSPRPITHTSCYSLPWFPHCVACYSSYTTHIVLISRPFFTLFFLPRMLFLNPSSFSSVFICHLIKEAHLDHSIYNSNLYPTLSPHSLCHFLCFSFSKVLTHWYTHTHTQVYASTCVYICTDAHHMHTLSIYAYICTHFHLWICIGTHVRTFSAYTCLLVY